MQVEQPLLRAALHLTVLYAEHDLAVFLCGVILVPDLLLYGRNAGQLEELKTL